MSHCTIAPFLVSIDYVFDYSPGISTLTNALELIRQGTLFFTGQITPQTNAYYTHLNNKSLWRSLILLVPVIGNVVVWIHDLATHQEKERKKIALTLCHDYTQALLRYETLVNVRNEAFEKQSNRLDQATTLYREAERLNIETKPKGFETITGKFILRLEHEVLPKYRRLLELNQEIHQFEPLPVPELPPVPDNPYVIEACQTLQERVQTLDTSTPDEYTPSPFEFVLSHLGAAKVYSRMKKTPYVIRECLAALEYREPLNAYQLLELINKVGTLCMRIGQANRRQVAQIMHQASIARWGETNNAVRTEVERLLRSNEAGARWNPLYLPDSS